MASKPASPAHLSNESRALFRTIARDFDLHDDAAALDLLRLACEARDRADEARRILAAEGIVTTTAKGDRRPHPAVAIERDARLAVARLFRELGLELGPGDTGDARLPRRGTGALA